MKPHPREREAFEQALDLDGEHLEAYLKKLEDESLSLRQRVEELLAQSDGATQEGNFLLSEPENPIDAIGIRVGDEVDGLKILDILGKGGFGVVYLAQQREPRREIALKVIKPGMDSKEVLARFEAERQALAIMDHPGIAKILHAGATERGLPYFAMEYVKGKDIVSEADRYRLDTRQRLILMMKVCEAVMHAHSKAVIHRDLKPANILVAKNDDGSLRPKIIDFGVAKAMAHRLTDLTLHTSLGTTIGTINYMSPEQAESASEDIDTQTDVYALGVILFELLVGRLPFDPPASGSRKAQSEFYERLRKVDPPKASTRIMGLDPETAEQIAQARRIGIEQLQKNLASELDCIPQKAMKPERSERYASVADLRDDIERYLKGEPIKAKPDSSAYRVKKFVGRHKLPLAVGGAFFGLLLASLVSVTILWVEAADSLKVAKEAKQDADDASDAAKKAKEAADDDRVKAVTAQLAAEKAKEQVEEKKRELESLLAQRERESYRTDLRRIAELNDRGRFGEIDRMVMADLAQNDLRGWEWAWLKARLESNRTRFSAALPVGGLETVILDVDARHRRMLIRNLDGLVLRQIDRPQEWILFIEGSAIVLAAFHSESNSVVAISSSGAPVIFSFDRVGELERTELRVAAGLGRPKLMALKENLLAVWFQNGELRLWSLDKPKRDPSPLRPPSTREPIELVVTPDGRSVIARYDGHPHCYYLRSQGPQFASPGSHVNCVAVAPAGTPRVGWGLGYQDGQVALWELDAEEPILTFKAHGQPVETMRFSSAHLLTVSRSEASLWDLSAAIPEPIWTEALNAPVTHAGFHETGDRFFMRHDTGEIVVFELSAGASDGEVVRPLGIYSDAGQWGRPPATLDVQWSEGGRGDSIVVADPDGIQVWEGVGLISESWEQSAAEDGWESCATVRGVEVLFERRSRSETEERLKFADGRPIEDIDGRYKPHRVEASKDGDFLAFYQVRGVNKLVTVYDVGLRQSSGNSFSTESHLEGPLVISGRDRRRLLHVVKPAEGADRRLELRGFNDDDGRVAFAFGAPSKLGSSDDFRADLSDCGFFVAVAKDDGEVSWTELDRPLKEYEKDASPGWSTIGAPRMEIRGRGGDLETSVYLGGSRTEPRLLREIRSHELDRIVSLEVFGLKTEANTGTQIRFDEDVAGVRRMFSIDGIRPETAAISPDGERVAVQYSDGQVALFDSRTGSPLVELELAGHYRDRMDASSIKAPYQLRFDHDGSRIFQTAGSLHRVIDIVDRGTREKFQRNVERGDLESAESVIKLWLQNHLPRKSASSPANESPSES